MLGVFFFFKWTIKNVSLEKHDFSLEDGVVESTLYTYLKMNYFFYNMILAPEFYHERNVV